MTERMTQQEVAEALDVSRQTVNAYINEPVSLVDGWTLRERVTLWSIVVLGDSDLLDEYLTLHRLSSRGR